MSSPGQPATLSGTTRIARNTFWYSLETVFEILATFPTSMYMAHKLGAERLGYFNLIAWMTGMGAQLASLGLPGTARKYMAEYLGKGEPGKARAVYELTSRVQMILAASATALSLILVFTVSDPTFRLISALQVISLLPSMLRGMPSQANIAAENMKANVAGTIVGQSIYIVAVVLSLLMGWDLLGVAIGGIVFRVVELLMRQIPVAAWMRSLPKETIDPELRNRLRSFAGNTTLLLLFSLVVFDRSDLLLLEYLTHDRTQLSFFNAAINLTSQILSLPAMVVAPVSAALMVQFGRDKERMPRMIAVSSIYMLLVAVPCLLGLASLRTPALMLLYGKTFPPAAPALLVACTLAIPRSLFWLANTYLLAMERQRFLVVWTLLCGILNIGLDLWLIPVYKAYGAAWGNGVAQVVATVGMFAFIIRTADLRLPWGSLGKIVLSGAVMFAAVQAIPSRLSPPLALGLGIPAGALLYFFLLSWTRAIPRHERDRLVHLGNPLPARFQPWYLQLVNFLAGPPQAVAMRKN